ncbi:unnamed protein product [Adineta steineri]|uniref:Uncharacterized protein n=1 Tax=Adineta steineri TaxID=433720 RepID=A0A815QVU0_9BILA|nr:unnamed protein product [Adineta steineri]
MTTTDNIILTSTIETYRHYAGQPTLSDIECCNQDSNDEILHLTTKLCGLVRGDQPLIHHTAGYSMNI